MGTLSLLYPLTAPDPHGNFAAFRSRVSRGSRLKKNSFAEDFRVAHSPDSHSLDYVVSLPDRLAQNITLPLKSRKCL
jgi:hypothetical protein